MRSSAARSPLARKTKNMAASRSDQLRRSGAASPSEPAASPAGLVYDSPELVVPDERFSEVGIQ